MPKHFAWWLLTIACVVWYSVITWYVAIRGAKDIKEMLTTLRNRQIANENDNLKDNPEEQKPVKN